MFNVLEIIILKGNSIYWLLKDKTEIFFFKFMRLLSLVFLEQHFDLKEVTFCVQENAEMKRLRQQFHHIAIAKLRKV